MFTSLSRLRADVDRWQAAGWVDPDGARHIKAELDARHSGLSLPNTLAVLGVVLIAFAAMSFVAANWQDLSKLARLTVLGTGLVASYVGADTLFRRGHDGFGHAAVLLGVAIFGASIMLIAQMYHMEGSPPDAVWLWLVGALAAGILIRSNPALGLAAILLVIWSHMTIQTAPRAIHWGFLPMWALAAFGVAETRWHRGMHLLALALSYWIVVSAFQWSDANGKYVVLAVGLALALGSIAFGDVIDRWRRISPAMLAYGMGLAFVALLVIQFMPRGLFYGSKTGNLWVWGTITLALIVGALMWAWRTENRSALWLAYAAFVIEIFALYIAKLGTLLNTSLFFLVTGLLVIALAVVAYRMHNAIGPTKGAAP